MLPEGVPLALKLELTEVLRLVLGEAVKEELTVEEPLWDRLLLWVPEALKQAVALALPELQLLPVALPLKELLTEGVLDTVELTEKELLTVALMLWLPLLV